MVVVEDWLAPPDFSASLGSPEGAALQNSASLAFGSVRREKWQKVALPYHSIIHTSSRRCTSGQCSSSLQLSADHLSLTLVYFNVLRGILSNIALLGLDYDMMQFDEYPSPFLPLSSSASSAIAFLPDSLMPTRSQKTMAHHPEIDVFPDAVFRDNWIACADEGRMDDDEFCFDLVGSRSRLDKRGSEGPGCWLRGEPWTAASWEFAEWFVLKYPFLFRGAAEFERGTNLWRRRTGLRPLCFGAAIELEVTRFAYSPN
ncbi:uncharacterized protein AB675_10135 [Cyphellophora attinorum]|uniref:Uncharacterized protein n=1 Tax=Cyphellophora attinorum TaxID=1664694 RepID=A0A0N1GXP0_9EURO|nr:uncharacterized protein AB675_10135 [Phialophora attinorum]KPI35177.1 hypothetical protein AB675_10135 [Phialophora attinorum]